MRTTAVCAVCVQHHPAQQPAAPERWSCREEMGGPFGWWWAMGGIGYRVASAEPFQGLGSTSSQRKALG